MKYVIIYCKERQKKDEQILGRKKQTRIGKLYTHCFILFKLLIAIRLLALMKKSFGGYLLCIGAAALFVL